MTKQNQVFAIKRVDGKIFKVGDKFNWKGNYGMLMVKGGKSTKKMRISGFEQHDKGWYVLYMPTYSNGVVEKNNAWRACQIESAILL